MDPSNYSDGRREEAKGGALVDDLSLTNLCRTEIFNFHDWHTPERSATAEGARLIHVASLIER